MTSLNNCGWCGKQLPPDDYDGSCASCDDKMIECGECGEWKMPDEPCAICELYAEEVSMAGDEAMLDQEDNE